MVFEIRLSSYLTCLTTTMLLFLLATPSARAFRVVRTTKRGVGCRVWLCVHGCVGGGGGLSSVICPHSHSHVPPTTTHAHSRRPAWAEDHCPYRRHDTSLSSALATTNMEEKAFA